MPIVIRCSCGKDLKVRDDLAGKAVKCPACGRISTAPGAASFQEAPPQPPSPVSGSTPPRLPPELENLPEFPRGGARDDDDEGDDEDRPRRRKRGSKPQSSGWMMWIVLAVVGAFLLLGCCCGLGLILPAIQKAR